MISSKLNYLPRAPFPNTITLRVGHQHMSFGGGNAVHSTNIYQMLSLIKNKQNFIKTDISPTSITY